MKATFFNQLDIASLEIVPPYQSRNSTSAVTRARGILRLDGRPLTFTGPKLRVVYSNCRWNRLVLEDSNTAFHDFLFRISDLVQHKIWEQPATFRQQSVSSNRFVMETTWFKPSADPQQYPDEIRFKLDSAREWKEDPETKKMAIQREWVTARLFDIEGAVVDPTNILRGGYVTPIVQASYYRDNEKFGVVYTILGARYQQPSTEEEVEWEMDCSEDA